MNYDEEDKLLYEMFAAGEDDPVPVIPPDTDKDDVYPGDDDEDDDDVDIDDDEDDDSSESADE